MNNADTHVILAVLAEHGAVGINDHGRVVNGVLVLLVALQDWRDDYKAMVRCQLCVTS
jgi:hypothetical protein